MTKLLRGVRIHRLGHRGEGVADGPLYVPYALPGDVVSVAAEGERGHLVEVEHPSAARVASFCRYFTDCGGCAVQTLENGRYAAWKRGIVLTTLAQAGVIRCADESKQLIAPLVDAHGEGRRRATFHARAERRGLRLVARVGFMQARAHEIVEIDACPILAPAMRDALPAARAIAEALVDTEKPLDILVTATAAGLDIDIRGCGTLSPAHTQALFGIADRHALARIANHGQIVTEPRTPMLAVGHALVAPPPGVFLQATQAGEEAIASLVGDGVGDARRVADLFAGIGTFALRLAERADVHAVDAAAGAIAALAKARRGGLRPHALTSEVRDLMRRPLSKAECDAFDAVVFDPPRAGAALQASELAGSKVATVVAVSCSVATFARDARTLVDGGYRLEQVTPVDQFRHSPHVEIVGVFRRPKAAGRPRRPLLG